MNPTHTRYYLAYRTPDGLVAYRDPWGCWRSSFDEAQLWKSDHIPRRKAKQFKASDAKYAANMLRLPDRYKRIYYMGKVKIEMLTDTEVL